MTDLGTALAILRVVRGWSQTELAEAAGMRSGTISDYERGKIVPSRITAKKLLAAQGYSWPLVGWARDFILSVRAGSVESSSSVGQNEAEPSAQDWEIEEISTLAGSVVSRFVRFALKTQQQGIAESSRQDLRANEEGKGEQGGEEGA